MKLSENHADLLKETLNLGVGAAADALSEIAGGEEIILTVPQLQLMSTAQLARQVCDVSGEEICSVTETFRGPFSGKAMMLYSQRESLELVRLMLGDMIPVEQIREMEGEALCEVGNIVLNACLASLADMIGSELQTDIPELKVGQIEQVLSLEDEEHSILYLRMDFTMARHNLQGHIGFVFDLDSVTALIACLENYLKSIFEI
ncbi:hypothetical protein [Acanthopleuribacter pedis]|uniref:Chemotaxis protein CheC n=1 Tax=Acanthopleuribacter pedis TaxID=442870 RepID=A0A8J7Q4D3_9BACT|nr:hypothetical protein [Acanthopleuribacter pedis]MBO1320362.1 hypothetical protein [Acanthopleuribacter pedis]